MADRFDDDRTETHITLTSGTMVSHYRIIERIGYGGMGEVYLADDVELGRKVALKFLSPHICQDVDRRARFRREAQAAGKLNDPNIVSIHEVSEFKGRPFFVMEHLEGRSLAERIRKSDLSIEEVVDLSIRICEGLNKAHLAGIVHRDIKPSNIMTDEDGHVKILDFGLASIKGAEKLTKTGSTLGTLHYMSPEQTRGEIVDGRSDIFSFGIVLYEMITGQLPFKGDHTPAIIYSIGYQEVEPLAKYKAGVPDELQRIVSKALAKQKGERYQHADELLTDLKTLSRKNLSTFHGEPPGGFLNRGAVTATTVALLIVAGNWVMRTYVTQPRKIYESGRKMLAILPFQNLSPDSDIDYFSEGLTEELTTKLSDIESLCLISRSSAMTFKRSSKKIPEIASELKAQYIVEGSVRRAGNELRITAQLVDAATDGQLWANTFSGTLDDVFDTQDNVTLAIVEGIRVQLTPQEIRPLERPLFGNPNAHAGYQTEVK